MFHRLQSSFIHKVSQLSPHQHEEKARLHLQGRTPSLLSLTESQDKGRLVTVHELWSCSEGVLPSTAPLVSLHRNIPSLHNWEG